MARSPMVTLLDFASPDSGRHPFAALLWGAAIVSLTLSTSQSQAAQWPAPEVTDSNLNKILSFIRPKPDELKWRKMRWHQSLSAGANEAQQLQRPVMLWTMNGHPCGET